MKGKVAINHGRTSFRPTYVVYVDTQTCPIFHRGEKKRIISPIEVCACARVRCNRFRFRGCDFFRRIDDRLLFAIAIHCPSKIKKTDTYENNTVQRT